MTSRHYTESATPDPSKRYASDLDDREFEILAPYVAQPRGSGKKRTVNIREVPGYRIEMSPFGGVKDSGLGYKEGVLEAMKSFTNVKTYSLPWL